MMAKDMAANTDFASAHKVVGVLGGGQLGRMMARCGSSILRLWASKLLEPFVFPETLNCIRRAAHDMGIKLIALDPLENSPAGQICHRQILGDFKDADKVHELAKHCDVLTVEIEHVNADALAAVQKASGVWRSPSSACLCPGSQDVS
jgi:phosphoribosylaminoimidazole carboxylase (NCAIR synthetase)